MIDLWLDGTAVRAISGAIAALLSVIAFVPYITNTLRGHTRPQRACWLIWSVLSIISTFSLAYEGATASLGFSAAQAGCTTLVALIAIVRGQGAFLTKSDVGVLCLAGSGILLWYATDSAAYALVIAIIIGFIGGLLTIQKTYWFPDTETMSTWVLSFIAAGFALVAVGQYDWVLLAYPAYLFLMYGAIISAWALGHTPRARVRQNQMGVFQSVRSR
ncbi:MAG TPA: hypothetical protein VJ928_09450 [Marivita sp.]|nr:hypothetical protein [Marivita sp.]